MKKTSTSTMTIQQEVYASESISPRPSKLTLDFIKQFARSYHCETRLSNALSGMNVN